MILQELLDLTQTIVTEAQKLSITHTNQTHAPVNYACIFSQNQNQFDQAVSIASTLGTVVEMTAMGPVFKIGPISTSAGNLSILKIRRPDPRRNELGDADFTVPDYEAFKKQHLGKPGFDLIKRKRMEMIELADPLYDVLTYYSHPILAKVLGLNIQ